MQNNYETPNGFDLSTLVICNNEPCKSDSLEGLDGWLYITTKEELDEFLTLDYEAVLNKIAKENKDFNIKEYQ